jgi:hypothetical protein
MIGSILHTLFLGYVFLAIWWIICLPFRFLRWLWYYDLFLGKSVRPQKR